ncbi:Endonuclease G, mitochondrial [Orchesella cincta]|uniref:Endonuclease G, mitochondrial n=1 Tax=Orchesella cincta TaxID=48709 RepID=A0A1D2MFA2_ORCCI|nr:Endonuclease G, mitochondrial [Orchesella cincta]
MARLAFILFVVGSLGSQISGQSTGLDTCGLTQPDGINTFTLRTASPLGNIPLIHIQYDVNRKLPITSTVMYDNLNLVQNVERVDNFRNVECGQLTNKQQNCANTMRLSLPQKSKVNSEYNSWDRGHLTPVNPMRFSAEAVNATYYCPNIAPQEPWTNRCPWYAVEERTLSRTKSFPSYVMTGTCASDNVVDGNTYYNLTVPDCFWKMACYLDPTTKETNVVAFISENHLIQSTGKAASRVERTASTTTPRAQLDVLNLMGARSSYVETAWLEAERILTEGRGTTGLPSAATCVSTKDISVATVTDWTAFMKLHRPPFDC